MITETETAVKTKNFTALPWQLPPFYNYDPVILLTGSAGGGKSHIALEKINAFCLRYPGAFCLMLRKVKVSMTSGSALFFDDMVSISQYENHLTGARHVQSKSRFEYGNGSIVAYMGLEDKKQRQRLKSIGRAGGVDLAFMEEATEFEEADYNAVIARMRGKAASWTQIILACNPDAPTHWIYTRLIQGGEAKVFYSGADDNPHNPDSYKDSLGRLTGTEGKRLRDGQWVQATGLVYEKWIDGGEGGNVTDEADYIPDGGYIYWAIDDGYTGEIDPISRTYTANSHPRVVLLCQLRANGRLCVFDEIYTTRTQPEAHIKEVIEAGYPDPDFAAVDKSAAQLIGLLNTMGIATQKGPPSVEESIKETRTWIEPDLNNFRRLWVHPRCRHFRREMLSYIYDDNGKPVKQFDHGPDALRYLIWRLRYY